MNLPVPPPPPIARTAPKLRGYQQQLKDSILTAWGGLPAHGYVLAVSATGSGKTVLLSSIVHDHNGASCVLAHRQELIAQISCALAREGIRHRILAPDPQVRAICAEHLTLFGKVFYDPTARVGCASVQSLTKSRVANEARWLQQVTLLVVDEAAHCLKANIWGRACDHFPNAKGLGVTATPCRADNKGLGKHADGIFDVMVKGPPMRELMELGYLNPYRKIGATIHIDLAGVKLSKDGDYILDRGEGKRAVRASPIISGCVEKYRQYADGMQTIVFASDLETAEDMAQAFRDAGIPAEMLDGTTPDAERRAAMKRFARKETRVILNRDLFSEGLDIAGVQCVVLARPTMSFGLHAQQVGRALRLQLDPQVMREWDSFTVSQRMAHIAASKKPQAVVIDLVGNLVAPGLGPPERRDNWTLDAGERKSSGPNDAEKLVYCLAPACASPYEAFRKACPYCGKVRSSPTDRSSPEAVEGDITELDEAIFDALYGPIKAIAMPNDVYREQAHIRSLPSAWVGSNVKKHDAHRVALLALQESMAWYGGELRAEGLSDAEVFRKFWIVFGTDWLTAQAQDRATMEKLTLQVIERLTPASTLAMMTHMAG